MVCQGGFCSGVECLWDVYKRQPLQCVPVTTSDSCFNTFHGTINLIIWNYTLLKADAIQLQQNKKQNEI